MARSPIRPNRLHDLHVWSVAPGTYAAALGVVTHTPRPPEHYKTLIPAGLGIAHVTVEVQECRERPTLQGRPDNPAWPP
jgi:Co/Zn/Cd efflux system component